MSAPIDHTMLALTFERHADGTQLEKVPPHITVLPWFQASRRILDYVVGTTCEQTDLFIVYAGEVGEVGSEGHYKQARFVESPGLQKLHSRLFYRLADEGVEFSHPQWLGDNYRPHFRHRSEPGEMASNESRIFSHLAVVHNALSARDLVARKTITNYAFGER